MIIYKATNLINNKVYIGQTINTLDRRKQSHFWSVSSGSDNYFHKALRKHGEESFRWQVICICPNMDSLNNQEEYYIAYYDTMTGGYNLTSGGNGYILPDEVKEKMSILQTGENNSFYGKKHTDATKEKNRTASIRLWKNPEYRKNQVERNTGENNPHYGVRLYGEDNPNYKHGGRCK